MATGRMGSSSRVERTVDSRSLECDKGAHLHKRGYQLANARYYSKAEDEDVYQRNGTMRRRSSHAGLEMVALAMCCVETVYVGCEQKKRRGRDGTRCEGTDGRSEERKEKMNGAVRRALRADSALNNVGGRGKRQGRHFAQSDGNRRSGGQAEKAQKKRLG